eukprot:COSAG06_NODE_13222_length_1281_cov_0.947547_1_plen_159_part_01
MTKRSIGNCQDSAYGFLRSVADCAAAATALGLSDRTPIDAVRSDSPNGCYWKEQNSAGTKLFFNAGGDATYTDATQTRVSICSRNHIHSSCTGCSSGQYQPSTGSTWCRDCPNNKTSPSGSDSSSDCITPTQPSGDTPAVDSDGTPVLVIRAFLHTYLT